MALVASCVAPEQDNLRFGSRSSDIGRRDRRNTTCNQKCTPHGLTLTRLCITCNLALCPRGAPEHVEHATCLVIDPKNNVIEFILWQQKMKRLCLQLHETTAHFKQELEAMLSSMSGNTEALRETRHHVRAVNRRREEAEASLLSVWGQVTQDVNDFGRITFRTINDVYHEMRRNELSVIVLRADLMRLDCTRRIYCSARYAAYMTDGYDRQEVHHQDDNSAELLPDVITSTLVLENPSEYSEELDSLITNIGRGPYGVVAYVLELLELFE